MRLSAEQKLLILKIVGRLAGKETEVFLFGSRLNDRSRGGDVDLLIETEAPLSLIQRARLKMELEDQLGLPVDLVVKARGLESTPFQTIARDGALRLEV
jgi:predicted nucleotidyltransferase